MPRTRTDWLILTVIVAVVGALWIGVTRVQASTVNVDGLTPSPDIGRPAPDFTLQTLEGEELALSDLRGQPVLINFWATWCPPCRAEIPTLEQVSRQVEGEVVILGVDVQEPTTRVQEFVADYGMTYPVVLDEDAAVAQIYRIRAFPTTYFINSQGIVVDVFTGPLNEPLLYTKLAGLAGR